MTTTSSPLDKKWIELVALVGSQGSGKSSVLEALVGEDFLPKGDFDICTLRPLVLRLSRSQTPRPWGQFLHLPGKRFYDFSDIRNEILVETAREAGKQNGISDKEIHLKIFSPNVLDITFVDLPGLTKVADIDIKKNMILSYIKKSTCLILAFTPANSDLANSDALKMAKIADPHGHRTIGVITKLDIIEEGTNVRNMLLGKVVPLQLGYIGVVNRSQEDYLFNCNIDYALGAEENFFHSNPVYSGLDSLCGIPQLAKKLKQVLALYTEPELSELDMCISCAVYAAAKEYIGYAKISPSETELRKLDMCKSCSLYAAAKGYSSYAEIGQSKVDRGAVLVNFFSNYCATFSSMVEGKSEEDPSSELPIGAQIHYIFENTFTKTIEDIDPFEGLTVDNIQSIIQNATDPKSSLLVPEGPFRILVQRQIARFLEPSLQCAKSICDELTKISHRCLLNELSRFPVARKYMHEVVSNFLKGALEQLEKIIQNLIEIEMSYINFSHPDFIGGVKALEIAIQHIKHSSISLRNSGQKRVLPAIYMGNVGLPGNSHVEKISVGIQAHSNTLLSIRPAMDMKNFTSSGNNGSNLGISSIFSGSDISHLAAKECSTSKPLDSIKSRQQRLSEIPPQTFLKVSERYSEEYLEIAVAKSLLKSYYDIVKKNIKHYVPRAIVHALISPIKSELLNLFFEKLYREDQMEELKESDEFEMKRRQRQELLQDPSTDGTCFSVHKVA